MLLGFLIWPNYFYQWSVQVTNSTGDFPNKWCLLKAADWSLFCCHQDHKIQQTFQLTNEKNVFQPTTSQNSQMKWGISNRSSWIWVDLILQPWWWLETWSKGFFSRSKGWLCYVLLYFLQMMNIDLQTSLWLGDSC